MFKFGSNRQVHVILNHRDLILQKKAEELQVPFTRLKAQHGRIRVADLVRRKPVVDPPHNIVILPREKMMVRIQVECVPVLLEHPRDPPMGLVKVDLHHQVRVFRKIVRPAAQHIPSPRS